MAEFFLARIADTDTGPIHAFAVSNSQLFKDEILIVAKDENSNVSGRRSHRMLQLQFFAS